MQHQELMIYDFQHYFQRFPDPADNYKPIRRLAPPSEQVKKPTGTVEIPGGIYELGFSVAGVFAMIMNFRSIRFTFLLSK